MKNVDVPIWDKGDSTDNFAKGAGRAGNKFAFDQMVEADKEVIEVYKMVLGRKPSTRETAYYRISRAQKEEMILKLISSAEHKELILKAKKYPDVIEENSLLESNVLKLKSGMEDREKEYEELNILLEEKNNLIKELRAKKDEPFLTDKKLLEESTSYYSKFSERESISYSPDSDESLWDKVLNLFFKK